MTYLIHDESVQFVLFPDDLQALHECWSAERFGCDVQQSYFGMARGKISLDLGWWKRSNNITEKRRSVFRFREKGLTRTDTAQRGTDEIFSPPLSPSMLLQTSA